MTAIALSPGAIARFLADLEALAFGFRDRLGVAVSGGPDSMALLLLAQAALPGAVEAASVDHGLRPEGAAEAAGVAALCRRLGVPHATLAITVPDGPAGLQAEARAARYAALDAWAHQRGLCALATAHHADDQAETVLMRLQRGAGVAGLAGVRPVRRDGDMLILRPLLGWTKAELAAIVGQAGIEPVQDPSNSDPRFDRARMRRFLGDHPEFQPARLARSAAACREADEALAWMAEGLAGERITFSDGEWRLDPSGLPRALVRRLLGRVLADIRAAHGLGETAGGREDVERLLAGLERGGTGTLAGVVARGGGIWRLRPAPPRRATRS